VEFPFLGGQLFDIKRGVLVEVSAAFSFSLEAGLCPEVGQEAVIFASTRVGVVVEHSSEVTVVSVSDEEVVNERGEARHEGISFGHGVLVGRSFDHGKQFFGRVMFVAILITLEHEATGEAVFEAVRDTSGDIGEVDGGEFAITVEAVDNASIGNSLLHEAEHVSRVGTEAEVGGQESHIGVSIHSGNLSLSAELDPAFAFMFGVSKVVLDGVADGKVLNSLLLGKLSSGDEEVVLV